MDGDRDYEIFVEERAGLLLRTAFAMSGSWSDAEDLVQATLLKVYRSWGRVQRADNVNAYVRRALVNEYISLRRRVARRVSAERSAGSTLESDDDDPEFVGRDALWSVVNSLPRRQRIILALRYIDQLSDAEIATALNCTASTVRAHASRALTALRRSEQLEGPEGAHHAI